MTPGGYQIPGFIHSLYLDPLTLFSLGGLHLHPLTGQGTMSFTAPNATTLHTPFYFQTLNLDTSFNLSNPFNLWAVLIGLSLFNIAAFGTDQDMTQRMLTCRSASRGSMSLIVSYVIGWPVIALFLLIGLLLYVYYQRLFLTSVRNRIRYESVSTYLRKDLFN